MAQRTQERMALQTLQAQVQIAAIQVSAASSVHVGVRHDAAMTEPFLQKSGGVTVAATVGDGGARA